MNSFSYDVLSLSFAIAPAVSTPGTVPLGKSSVRSMSVRRLRKSSIVVATFLETEFWVVRVIPPVPAASEALLHHALFASCFFAKIKTTMLPLATADHALVFLHFYP